MTGFLDKVGNFFFKNDQELEDDLTLNFEDPAATKSSSPEPKIAPKPQTQQRKPNLISVPTRAKSSEGNLEIVLFKASSNDDMQEIARQIK